MKEVLLTEKEMVFHDVIISRFNKTSYTTYGSRYSRMDQLKFVEDSL